MNYYAFTDIVFNPQKSLNCQAVAAAIYVSLRKQNLLQQALRDKNLFLKIVYPHFKQQCSAKIMNGEFNIQSYSESTQPMMTPFTYILSKQFS